MTSLCDSFAATNDKPLTSLRIELQSGVFDLLPINLEDDPYELADGFIARHGIDRKIRELLANNIRTAKEIAVSKEDHKGNDFQGAFPSIFAGKRPFYEYQQGDIGWLNRGFIREDGKAIGNGEKKSPLREDGMEEVKDLKAPVDLLMKIKKILNPSLNKSFIVRDIDQSESSL